MNYFVVQLDVELQQLAVLEPDAELQQLVAFVVLLQLPH
jgi:hypothetical protein